VFREKEKGREGPASQTRWDVVLDDSKKDVNSPASLHVCVEESKARKWKEKRSRRGSEWTLAPWIGTFSPDFESWARGGMRPQAQVMEKACNTIF
jgi:hypothetical protein